MAKQKLLYISHNHPSVRPGGAEGYALDVYETVRDSSADFEAVFLSRTGPPVSDIGPYHDGRPLTAVNDDPNQYFFYTDIAGYDYLYGKPRYKPPLTRFYRDFLLAQQPDLIHFQHTIFLGYDILRVTKNTLPDVPIVYTLHEYIPICERNGQMVRTKNNELCEEESPRRCHECFPDVSPQRFFMRKRFIQSHLDLVDVFVTFSEYAVERYVDWGIPRSKIRYEPHGLPHDEMPPAIIEEDRRHRNRFGFFGQFTPFKGADVLLKAVIRMGDDFDGHLWMHGANLDVQQTPFIEEFKSLIEETGDAVTIVGNYDRPDLAKLMTGIDWVVVPSIWWETGPLVVPEAFAYGRPVICSDMGGMSEKVTDGVNGLYFRRGDADSLARTMRRASGTRGLWESLRGGIPPVRTMDNHVASLHDIYRALLARRGPAEGQGEPLAVVENV